MAPVAAAIVRQEAAGGIVEPRDPRELLAWIEANGGTALWVIFAIIVLAVLSRHGGGARTW